MTTLSIWLCITLAIASVTMVVVVWYLRKLLNRFLFISQNIDDLVVMVENYQSHLKQVYSMETYHGDETIKYLMGHTKSLLSILDDYKDVLDIIEPLSLEQENDINDENTNPEATEEEEETEVPFQISEENVFYAGSRRRDS